MKSLLISTLARYLVAFAVLATVIFGSAGSLAFVKGWIYLATTFSLMGIGFALLYSRDKVLLEKRSKTSEKEGPQKVFVAVSVILVSSLYVLPGLDFRFSWSRAPIWICVAGEFLLILGFLLYLLVMLQNRYASRVVEIQEDQRLIDTGLYSLVRHPMYSAMILVYIATPLVMGSYIALLPALLFPFSLAFRISNEEKVLEKGLAGYAEYKKRVRYRLFPFVW